MNTIACKEAMTAGGEINKLKRNANITKYKAGNRGSGWWCGAAGLSMHIQTERMQEVPQFPISDKDGGAPEKLWGTRPVK